MISPKMVSKFHLSFGFFMSRNLGEADAELKSAFSGRIAFGHVGH